MQSECIHSPLLRAAGRLLNMSPTRVPTWRRLLILRHAHTPPRDWGRPSECHTQYFPARQSSTKSCGGAERLQLLQGVGGQTAAVHASHAQTSRLAGTR